MFKNRAFRKLACAVLALVLTVLSASALAASVSAVIRTDGAKVYQSPSTGSVSVDGVSGTVVTVTAWQDGWARITYKGHEGYMEIGDLQLKSRIAARTETDMPVYASASSDSETLFSLDAGTKVYVTDAEDGWVCIQNKSGTVTGYVPVSAFTGNEAAVKEISEDSAKSAAELAVSFKGYPYGTDAPNSFTCATLVSYCFGQFGYTIPDTASGIAEDSDLQKITDYSGVQCGDILCFDGSGDGTCDHMAIYLGKGYFCEANPNAGKVQINSVSSWYKSHLMFIRRV